MKRRGLVLVFLFSLLDAVCARVETLEDFLNQHPGEVFYDMATERLLFHSPSLVFTLSLDSGYLMTQEGEIFQMGSENPWPQLDLWMKRSRAEDSPFQVGVIMLDPGHGGQDPGALATHNWGQGPVTLREKDLTLDLSLRVRDLLAKGLPHKNLVMTRSTDVYPTLEERVEMANQQSLPEGQAVLFISIHFNASLNPKAKGHEVWYIPEDFQRDVLSERWVDQESAAKPVVNQILNLSYKTESKRLAQFLSKSFEEILGSETEARGIKEKPWFVVRKANMPAVLIEAGFVTQKDEAKKLLDEKYLQKLAQAIYNGIKEFIQAYESSN